MSSPTGPAPTTATVSPAAGAASAADAIAVGQHVAEEHRPVVVDRVGHPQQVRVGARHQDGLGLRPREVARRTRPRRRPATGRRARSARCVHHQHVAARVHEADSTTRSPDRHAASPRPPRPHDARPPRDPARRPASRGRAPVQEVQVRPADRRRRHADDRVGGVAQRPARGRRRPRRRPEPATTTARTSASLVGERGRDLAGQADELGGRPHLPHDRRAGRRAP